MSADCWKEVKYLLQLCQNYSDDISDELLSHIENSTPTNNDKQKAILTGTIFKFLQKNIVRYPAMILYLLNKLEKCEVFQPQYIKECVKQLIKNEINANSTSSDKNIYSDNYGVRHISTLISEYTWYNNWYDSGDKNIFLPIYSQFNPESKELYLSLLSHSNNDLIDLISLNNLRKSTHSIWPLTANAMFCYCFGHQKHWLFEAYSYFNTLLEKNTDVDLYVDFTTQNIFQLILIDLMNHGLKSYEFLSVIKKIERILYITGHQDNNLKKHPYFKEIIREINLISFCMKYSKRKNLYCLNDMLSNHSALSLISHFCDLSQLDSFKVKQFLNTNKELLHTENNRDTKEMQWDIMTYKAYCIITYVIQNILVNSCDTNANSQTLPPTLDEIKTMILSISSISYQFEILQNIFSCLFLRYEHFSKDDENFSQVSTTYSDCSYFLMKTCNNHEKCIKKKGFVCGNILLKDILYMLRDCVSYMYENYAQSSSNLDINEIKILENFILHGIWKWEFISTLNFETIDISTFNLYGYNLHKSVDKSEKYARESYKRRRYKKQRPRSFNSNNLSGDEVKAIDNLPKTMRELDFVGLMLSPANSLIALCLELNDYSKAYKVLEMYDLSETEYYGEVSFTEQLMILVNKLKNIDSIIDTSLNQIEIERITGASLTSTTVMSIVESFLSIRKPPYHLYDLVRLFPQLQIYDNSYTSAIILVDILISAGITYDITNGVLNVTRKKFLDIDTKNFQSFNFVTFIKGIISIYFEYVQNDYFNIKKMGTCDLLNNDKVPLKPCNFFNLMNNLKEISKLYLNFTNDTVTSCEEFNSITDVLLNIRKIIISSNIQTSKNTSSMPKNNQEYSYIKYFIMYIKTISQIINHDDVNFCFADILNVPLHTIYKDLIYQQNIPLEQLEVVCKKIKINFIHKLLLNFCPKIKCVNEFKSDSEYSEFIKWMDDEEKMTKSSNNEDALNKDDFSKPEQNIVNYILTHNWVVANLFKKMHSDHTDNILQQSLDMRTKFLDIYLQRKRFDTIKMFYDNTTYVALQNHCDFDILLTYIKSYYVNDNLKECLKIFDALPEKVMKNDCLKTIRNKMAMKICLQNKDSDDWKFIFFAKDEFALNNLLLSNLTRFKYEETIETLHYLSHNSFVSDNVKSECTKWIEAVTVYQKVSEHYDGYTWADVLHVSKEDPENVLQTILDNQHFLLCLEWSKFHFISENIRNLVSQNYLKQCLQHSSEFICDDLDSLLHSIPSDQAVSTCKDILLKIRDLNILKIVVKFLIQNSYNATEYENIRIGVELISEMNLNERPIFYELISQPLLIIEQYLMNAKLDKLDALLKKVRPLLSNDPVADNLYYNISLINTMVISVNAVNALVRFYAAKALDLKLSKNAKLSLPVKQPEEKLFSSLDSIHCMNTFLMPDNIPDKDNWAPDSSSDRCMICKVTIFSILIRRHHCRRCGRLTCYLCSRHKLQLTGYYGNIKVRVCDECYTQTVNKTCRVEANDQSLAFTTTRSTSEHSDSPSMEWFLTLDPKHNDEMRKEFVYEFSPNVNLCLTIMKMHSVNLDYPRFLLDRSSELSIALSKANDGVLELIRMKRAILVSCSVLYSQPLSMATTKITEAALAHTDYQLDITDALTMLATNGCHSMMPLMDSLDTHYIRKLLQMEKWELALDICTKFGMSRNGVLAAWGMACLKSGCFNKARKKFGLYFKNNPSTINPIQSSKNKSTEEVLSEELQGFEVLQSSVKSEQHIKNNVGLLDEIILILEVGSYKFDPEIVRKAESIKSQFKNISSHKSGRKIIASEPALNIMHSLSSIQNIKNGNFSDFFTSNQYKRKNKHTLLSKKPSIQTEKFDFKRKLEPFFYNECIHYLSSYGSHGKLIEFQLKYDDLHEALQYCLNNAVNKEIFTEKIFLPFCDKNKINRLLKALNEMDNSWKIWTDYLLHSCQILKHRNNLEILHIVQSDVGDYVRAAMTCIKLYIRPTQSPRMKCLYNRMDYLVQAREHLQRLPKKQEPVQALASKSLQLQMDSLSIERHINTIGRQIEVTTILCESETSGFLTENIINEIKSIGIIADDDDNECFVPTLFGTQSQKIQLATLLLICNVNINEGLIPVFRLIKEHNLPASKVFTSAVKYFVNAENYEIIQNICDYLKTYPDDNINSLIDSVIEASVTFIIRKCDSKGQLFDELVELFIMRTENISLKISCYIESRNLKTALNIAIQNNRYNDLKRIMREAEKLGQTSVRNACLRKLGQLA